MEVGVQAPRGDLGSDGASCLGRAGSSRAAGGAGEARHSTSRVRASMGGDSQGVLVTVARCFRGRGGRSQSDTGPGVTQG